MLLLFLFPLVIKLYEQFIDFCVCLVNTVNLNKKVKICYGFGAVFKKKKNGCFVVFYACIVAVYFLSSSLFR